MSQNKGGEAKAKMDDWRKEGKYEGEDGGVIETVPNKTTCSNDKTRCLIKGGMSTSSFALISIQPCFSFFCVFSLCLLSHVFLKVDIFDIQVALLALLTRSQQPCASIT